MKNFSFWKTKNFEEITNLDYGAFDRLRPLEEFKILYHRPIRIGFKELIKNFFLKFLKIIFPSRFYKYEKKIKNNVKKARVKMLGSNITIERYLYLVMEHIFVRIKYLNYYYVPYNHLHAFHVLNKFIKILKSEKIDFFLVQGSLLGAVRQGNIAGSASDIDLGIKENQLQMLMNLIPLLKRRGVDWIRQWPNDKCERLQFFFPNQLVDVGIYRKENIENKEVWIGETEKKYDQKFCGITFPISDLENLTNVKLYGKNFPAPDNSEIYLKKKYGENWKIPDKKQFFFQERKFK